MHHTHPLFKKDFRLEIRQSSAVLSGQHSLQCTRDCLIGGERHPPLLVTRKNSRVVVSYATEARSSFLGAARGCNVPDPGHFEEVHCLNFLQCPELGCIWVPLGPC